ncbi:MAG: M15 family metallopeptidase [Bdellovibrionales bacterium]|nr:M15 family metallopeptidase [Bdellovibrionales bacterium]
MTRVLETSGKTIRLLELTEAEHGVKLDVRYAREDNFIGRKVYPSPHVFLLDHVAADLLSVHGELQRHGFGILIFDGYRPWSVTKMFWDLSDSNTRSFLANPSDGSSHNRGCAVDLGLFELSSGAFVKMPSDFDEMNEKAYRDYSGGDSAERERRDLLRRIMERNHFDGIKNEWWHYNHSSRKDWPVLNFSFEEILKAPQIRNPLQAE